ncbi:MAG: hypothetical protein ISR82_08570 [Candidatus Marinimicrobia bacterium]|nr:hypothetical protein [Candidatus Neomarinimicrobiota bacterium]MBL7011261.1 hypothetical protein [Candidatus Neomarinimicrobiota bacterium]
MEEQIKIIRDILEKTRRNVADNGKYFIMWGWLTLAASIGQYGLIYFEMFEWIGIMWAVLMTSGAIVSGVIAKKSYTKSGVIGYADHTIGSLWMACGLSIFLLAFVGMPLGAISIQALNPIIMTIIWIGVFVTSRVIAWKPLQWSAFLWLAGAFICMMIHWHYHGLITAVILIPGYLIPGYAMRKKFKSSVNV